MNGRHSCSSPTGLRRRPASAPLVAGGAARPGRRARHRHLVNQERQGGLVEGFWIFLPFQYAAFGLTLILVRQRDPRAPAVAVLLGSLAVVAFIGAHVVPWGPQPFGDYDVPASSWILVFVPMAVAVGVVAAGLRLR